MSEDAYRVYRLELPSDSRLPYVRRTELTPVTHLRPPVIYRKEFLPDFIEPTTLDEKRAWFLWYAGHHHLFFYWLLIAESNFRASYAVNNNNPAVAALWLNRASMLMRGSIGAMMNSGDFEPEFYQDFLRPAMARVRDDFAAGSSLEHHQLMVSIEELDRAVRNAYGEVNPIPEILVEAQRVFSEAKHQWFKYHFQVARRLQPGDSLLDKKLKDMEKDGLRVNRAEYLEKTIRSPEARADYDRFFGVTRIGTMYIEDFRTFLLYTLGEVRRHLSSTRFDGELLGLMQEGDDLMKVIVTEALDPNGVLRAA